MAPELFTERGVHSYASDLYALGCVLYECCVGKPSFVSNSLTELMEMILNDDPPPLFNGERAALATAAPRSAVGPDPPPRARRPHCRPAREGPARRLDWNAVLRHPFWRESGDRVVRGGSRTPTSTRSRPSPRFRRTSRRPARPRGARMGRSRTSPIVSRR